MSTTDPLASPVAPARFAFIVGVAVGSQRLVHTSCQPAKRPLVKPTALTTDRDGCQQLDQALRALGVEPARILIGLEATSRYNENLYQFLAGQGSTLCLLHPRQTHQFAQQRGLRAKTDRLDASTIARLLLSGEARVGYVPAELIATSRELARLHSQLSQESARSQNEIHALLLVLFPEFTQVFADPCRPTALGVRKRHPGAAAIAAAGVETVTVTLRELAPRHYGRPTAVELVRLAKRSAASSLASNARALSLKVLCDQLQHTLANLTQLDRELDRVLDGDEGASRLSSVPAFGRQTIAVLRAELGDVSRFSRMDQAVAYVGLDLQVRQSGKWKGQVKVCKRGSGRVRRVLSLAALRALALPDSPFATYSHRLVARGLKGRQALMAVMRKLLLVAGPLLRSKQTSDPAKGCALAGPRAHTPSPGS